MEVCAAAGATVLLETDPDTQAQDIAWLREQLRSEPRSVWPRITAV